MFKENFLKGVQIGFGIFFSLSLLLGIIYAVGFHSANEIIGGVFQGDYIFNGSIGFSTSNSFPTITNNESRIFYYIGNQTTGLVDTGDSNTLLLIHSNSTNGDTNFIDSSPQSNSITPSGDVIHSISQSQFGNTSLYFDGTGDSLLVADTSLFDLGTGDFTIDFWMYPTSAAGSQNLLKTASGGAGNNFFFYRDGSGWAFNVNNNEIYYLTDIVENAWSHIAIVRNSGTVTVYHNGSVATASTTSNPKAYSESIDSEGVRIGSNWDSSAAYYNGYLDEFRISNISRWTTTFTPPTTIHYSNGTIGYAEGLYIKKTNGTIVLLENS